jgi:hypothetical protein
MNPAKRTGVYLGVAGLLLVLALVTSRSSGRTERFTDEGELFFAEFEKPEQAASLEIYAVDAKTAAGRIFKVHRQDGLWKIPSHYDYPADAKKRMANAAGLVIGLKRGSVRSDSRADHESLGVVDPRDTEAKLEGRGLLVTFKDENGKLLGELIIGKEVEGRSGQRFVRLPEQRRTYMATITADLSTSFGDWVETDLLKLAAWDVEKLVFDNYSVDEQAGAIRKGDRIVAKKVEEGKWTVEGMDEEKEELDTDTLDEVGRILDDLKIVGVRPKPAGIDETLKARGIEQRILLERLMQKGYFLANDGKVYSNEGDLLLTTKEGVVYTLRFGEILYGSADEVSAGREDESEPGEDGKEEEKKQAGANRYLMITVDFDLSWFEKPEGEPYPEEEVEKRRKAVRDIRELDIEIARYKVEKKELPKTVADALSEDDKELGKDPWGNDYVLEPEEEGGYRVLTYGKDGKAGGEGADSDLASDGLAEEEKLLDLGREIEEWEGKLKTGRERAAELKERFAPWYYVIDAASFDKLKLGRADIVKPVEKDEPEDGGEDEGEDEGKDEDEKKDESEDDTPEEDNSEEEEKADTEDGDEPR